MLVLEGLIDLDKRGKQWHIAETILGTKYNAALEKGAISSQFSTYSQAQNATTCCTKCSMYSTKETN